MAAVNDNLNSELVICGRGRIGSELQQSLEQSDIPFINARISVEGGLVVEKQGNLSQIKVLVICISARHRGEKPASWQWQDIFLGLKQQVACGQLVIENIIMVSSTRVYEGYQSGLVEAGSLVKGSSLQAEGLITAEHILLNLDANTTVLRCSGLYGRLYPRYTPILKAGKDKPRFGVDAAQVVKQLKELVELGMTASMESKIVLLTDGNVYADGETFRWPEDRDEITGLSKSHRILLNSDYFITQ